MLKYDKRSKCNFGLIQKFIRWKSYTRVSRFFGYVRNIESEHIARLNIETFMWLMVFS